MLDRKSGLFVAVLGTLVAMLVAASGATADQPARPSVFKAGAAAVNINPDSPQYPGGYDYKAGPFQEVNDPLEVRAFVVGQGKEAAVLVSADSTGWFSAYHSPVLEPYGIDPTRKAIAEQLNNRGYDITAENVIINSTHAHSTPTLVGIWGTVDWKYLKKVSTSAVEAAVKAADTAKESELWAGTGSVRSLVWQNGQGTNHPDGYEADNQLPIIWARDPDTGATNALYANIPNHPDQFRASAHGKFSGEVPGYVRRVLDEQNGGTAVIAAGTLGRQEPPGSVNEYSEVIPQAEFNINQIQQTMARATPVTRGGIDASQRRFSTEADNTNLLLLIDGFLNPPGACIDDEGYCTIPRSKAPDYYTKAQGGNPAKVSASTHMIRIGDVLVGSNPGEAFPEVNRAIRESIQGARQIHMAGLTDMLGYYYRRSDYNAQQIGSSNFNTYNVGPDLGQDNAIAAVEAASDLGYDTTAPTVAAQYDPDVERKPGVQWYPNRTESANPTVNIYGAAARSQDKKTPEPSTIEWDFGDGKTATTEEGERFDHTFPGPGTYEVTATVSGEHEEDHVIRTRTWTDTITIDPDLKATAKVASRNAKATKLKVGASGGSGTAVAARWTCPNGRKLDGLSVTCPGKGKGQATVTLVDGAGNTATSTVKVPKGPALKVAKVKPKVVTLKRGRRGIARVVIANRGGAVAKRVKVCLAGNRVARPVRKCTVAGKIKAGGRKTVKLKLKAKRRKGRAALKMTVTSGNAGKSAGRIRVRVK